MKHRLDPDQVHSPIGEDATHRDHAYFQLLRRRLRWRLLVAYVTPLLALSVYFHLQYTRTYRGGIDNHLRSVAENQRNTVDLFLQERVANLLNALPGEALSPETTDANLGEALAGLKQENPTFVDLGLFDPEGILIAYAGEFPFLKGKNYGQEEWYESLHSRDRSHFISDVYLGFRGKPHFVVAVRHFVGSDYWTLRASVDPRRFGEFVGGSHLMTDAEAFIVNPSGQRQTLSETSESPVEPDLVPSPDAETQVVEVDVGGKEYLRAVAWLAANDWALVVRVPTDRAYASLHRARLTILSIMLLILVFIVAVVLRSTRRLVGRLEKADRAKEDLRLQLFNAAKLASVGEMAAGVAHEINNPLAIIYEEASMMKDLLDPQFQQEFEMEDFKERLGAITDATMRGRGVTSKLLAYSRQHDPDPELTDINQLIDRVLDVKEQNFKVSDIEVKTDLAENLPLLMVNRNQMDQVLLNLLNNAKDAIDDDGTITVRALLSPPWVEIQVEDTGCGMPPEVMERVFFPFFTTKGVGKGTGLGLSISYGIIKALGGRIEVASEVGVGTTFTIFLPIKGVKPKVD